MVEGRDAEVGCAKRQPGERRRPPVAMIAAMLALLGAGLALQLLAFSRGGHHTLSDLPRVFLHRGIGPDALPYIDRVIEYPVGAGVLLWLASLVAPTALGVLLVTAAAATGLCVWITVVLERRSGSRAWRWALAPALFVFAFQNWDVFAVAAMLAGILAFERRRDGLAGGMLGLGAAIKLFPAVVVPPLALARWIRGDRRGAVRLVGWSALVFAVLNLPFAVIRPSGWLWTFTFQSSRQATWGTVWFWSDRQLGLPVSGTTGAQFSSVVSIAALALGLSWLSVSVVRHRHHELDAAALAAAAVAIFLLTNKVYSPTYDVWMVVFFVLLPLSRRLWLAFCAVDLAIYALVYGMFYGYNSIALVNQWLPVLVVVRAVVLVAVIVAATPRRSRATGAATAEPERAPDAVRPTAGVVSS